jgi:hypothetical protein
MCYLRNLLVFVIVPTLGRLFTEEDGLNESDYLTPNKWSWVANKNMYAFWLQNQANHNFEAGLF